mgnify:CR=1 FL=1
MVGASLADLRVGAVSYLNTRPLIHGLDSDRLTLDVPARLTERFLAGELDVALLPLFSVLEAGGGCLVDDVGISCVGEVFSVLVASQSEFASCGEIHLDPSSRSSSALLKVLLAEFYQGQHRLLSNESVPDGASRLLIGDPAIAFRRAHGTDWQYHDLGALWRMHTGLPFVFAVWALASGVDPGVGDFLRAAKVDGMAARNQIANGLKDPEAVRRYLTEDIRYGLGDAEKAAIARFESLARRHGILPAGESAKITWC